MKIVVICPLVPYPLTEGGKKAVYYPLKYLAARGYQITLLCTTEHIDEEANKELSKISNLVITQNKKKPTVLGLVRSLFSRTPYILSRFHNKKHLQKILERTAAGCDCVQIEGIHAAFYGLEIKKRFHVPVILRLVNLESANLASYADHYPNPIIKWFLRFEVFKMRRYEKRTASQFDKVLMITEEDERKLRLDTPSVNTVVIPGGVDLQHFTPTEDVEEEGSVLWMGALQWPPNQDSFWWFYRCIIPILVKERPSIKIYVVGSNPPQEILQLSHINISIVGQVEDVRDYIRKVQVCVVPLRAGSGIRMKLLEMFALKKAVVSTSLGCEGMQVEHGRHLLVADSAQAFADAVITFLSDEKLRQECSRHAFEFVKQHYDWERIVDKYEEVYKNILQEQIGK
jgi:polysaccharide biosynthesis protein PslH